LSDLKYKFSTLEVQFCTFRRDFKQLYPSRYAIIIGVLRKEFQITLKGDNG